MNEFDDMPMMGEVMTRDAGGFSMPQAAANQGDVAPYGGAALIQTTNRNVTAQRVAVPRALPSIMREIREYCAQFGDTYVYAWEAKDRQKGAKAVIEGGTIKMAMMLQQVFGNCSVDMDVSETPTHMIFKAWFTDFEKGTQLSRLFQQRRGQNTGMGDKDRQADIIFQIGQSKAARNVILNALASFAAYALEESKKGMLAKLASPEAKESAWAFIDATLARNNIEIKRLEAVIGRSQKDFTIRDLAKAYMLVRGVAEGLVAADDAFPTAETADEINKERAEDDAALKKREGRTPKAKAEPKKDEPKPETEKASDEMKPDVAARQATAAASMPPLPADETFPGDLPKGETLAKADSPAPATADFDEDAALDQIEQMFDGLDKIEDVETTRDSLVGVISKLSEAGLRQATMTYNTAQNRAKAKAAEVKPAPSLSTELFSDD